MYTRRLSFFTIVSHLLMVPLAHAQVNSEKHLEKAIIVDRYMSPYASSACLFSTRTFLNEGEDYLFPPQKTSSVLGRYVRSVGNNFLNDALMLISHEVNGHGFRARSLGVGVRGYSGSLLLYGVLGVVTPANSLGGATHYLGKSSTIEIDLLEVIAGNEANSVLAQQLVLQHFARGTLDYRMYNFFFKSFTNLLGYIVLTTDRGVSGMSKGIEGDITVYQRHINQKHGKKGIQLNTLRWASVSFLLNPILYVSLWSFYAHIIQGTRQFPIPRLQLGSVQYMPLIRMGLTPFGIAYYLDNYFGYGEKAFLVSLNGGKSPFYTHLYGGLQVQTNKLLTYQRYSLDVEGYVWYQPKLLLAAADQLEDKNHWGGLVGIDNKFQLTQYLSLNAGLSYKTRGFAEGVVADSGFHFRGGFTLHY